MGVEVLARAAEHLVLLRPELRGRAFRDASECIGTHWDALGCIGMHWDALGCIGMHWDALGCIGMHWDAFVLFQER